MKQLEGLSTTSCCFFFCLILFFECFGAKVLKSIIIFLDFTFVFKANYFDVYEEIVQCWFFYCIHVTVLFFLSPLEYNLTYEYFLNKLFLKKGTWFALINLLSIKNQINIYSQLQHCMIL